MRALLLGAAILAAPILPAHAIQILNAAQTSATNTVVGTANAGGTQTTITITDAAVDIAQIAAPLSVPIAAFVDLAATSIDAAVGIGPALLQHYSGTFCVSSAAGCTGTDYLSGSFSDAAFGLQTGSQLSVNISNPPDTLSITSGVGLPIAAPSSLTFAMSNVTPALALDNATIASFGASFVETANATAAPEPASLGMLAVGLIGLGMIRYRRRGPMHE